MSIALRENINWVGCIDWNVRDFHGYDTDRGTTYNAYLVRDEKTALIDTVKAPFGDQLLRNVAELVDLSEVDYVVCNHAEPDHAGSLPVVLEAMPQATLVCDKKCQKALTQHFDTSPWKIQTVTNGDSLPLGKRSLSFVETPMVHWPESMFTYVPEERILFSMDAFGQHYASSARFDDELPINAVIDHARAYYANIVMPYGKQVAGTLEKAAGLDIDLIAPSHGLMWRGGIPDILAAYGDWAICRSKPKVLVVYDTMWESTDQMAKAIVEGASQEGVSVVLAHVRKSNLTQVATESLDAAVIAIGSPTLNRGAMPMIGAAMTYLGGLRPTGKAAMAFGSYGWGRGGPEVLDQWIDTMKWERVREPLRCQYRPTPEMLDDCRNVGKMLAEKAREIVDCQSR